jgi:hypothetical protein
VSKSNSLKLRERIVSQAQQLDAERREHERLRAQHDAQTKLLEETEAHLDELRASNNHRLSRIGIGGDEDAAAASIAVYHARITALETRLDQLEGENEESEVRHRALVVENTALRDKLAELEDLKREAHALMQEMRARVIAAEERGRSEVRALEDDKAALLHANQALKDENAAKQAAQEHAEHERQRADAERDALRAQYDEADALTTRLRTQLDALSNEHADLTARAEQERAADQQRVSELEHQLLDEAAKADGLQREIGSKDDELARLRETLETQIHPQQKQQPSPPHTLSTATSASVGLHPHPTNPFGFGLGLGSHAHARQRSVSGSSTSASRSGSIRGMGHHQRQQDERGHGSEAAVPPATGETPPSPESPPVTASKVKRSRTQRLGSLFGVHIGHHHHHNHNHDGSEDHGSGSGSHAASGSGPGSGSGSGAGTGAGSGSAGAAGAAAPTGGLRQVS